MQAMLSFLDLVTFFIIAIMYHTSYLATLITISLYAA